jgi:hypothetical protein
VKHFSNAELAEFAEEESTLNALLNTKKAGTPVPAERRTWRILRVLDEKTDVFVSFGERDERHRHVVVADQVKKHFVYRAFAAVHSSPPSEN